MSGKATATKSLKEKWLSRVQSVREKGENGMGGPSTITSLELVDELGDKREWVIVSDCVFV